MQAESLNAILVQKVTMPDQHNLPEIRDRLQKLEEDFFDIARVGTYFREYPEEFVGIITA